MTPPLVLHPVMLDLDSAAAAAGNVDPRTIRNWIKHGKNGRKLRKSDLSRRVLIAPEWLHEFLTQPASPAQTSPSLPTGRDVSQETTHAKP